MLCIIFGIVYNQLKITTVERNSLSETTSELRRMFYKGESIRQQDSFKDLKKVCLRLQLLVKVVKN